MTSLPIAALFPKAWAVLRTTCSRPSDQAPAGLGAARVDQAQWSRGEKAGLGLVVAMPLYLFLMGGF